MFFVQKRRLSIFSRCHKMERSQKWPDFKSTISKFRDIHFIDTATDINHWKLQEDRSVGQLWRAYKLAEVRPLDVTWWPDLGPAFSHVQRKRYTKALFAVCAKNLRGCLNIPHPAGRGLNHGGDKFIKHDIQAKATWTLFTGIVIKHIQTAWLC